MMALQRETQAILALAEGFKALQQQLDDAKIQLQQAQERVKYLESTMKPSNEVQEAVQKCISKVALMGVTHWENQDIAWACDFIIKDIKEHFRI